jgi:hypothetical protein
MRADKSVVLTPGNLGTGAQLGADASAAARGDRAYAITIFLGAFLLFQIELIVAKQLLPWFGGGPVVWNTCLVFFQMLLLAGHAYAHLGTAALGAKIRSYTHVALLAVAVAVLAGLALVWASPVSPGVSWRPADSLAPLRQMLLLLLASVGLPFFLLATTGPLVQTWFAGTHPRSSPYRLYALSNLGSLLALLTYPLLVEPNLTLRNQGRVWAGLFLIFAGTCAACALRFARSSGVPGTGAVDSEEAPRTTWEQRLYWFALAACGCIMLLAVTNLMCQELAVVPFLWAIPLSIYLFSFILCFQQRRIYRRALFHPLFFAAMAWSLVEFIKGPRPSPFILLAIFGTVLFVACMVYHGELAALKPHPGRLTSFYLFIALGGASGSILVGMIVPHLFPALWEFQLGLWASGVLVVIILWREHRPVSEKGRQGSERTAAAGAWLHDHPRWLPILIVLAMVAFADYIGPLAGVFPLAMRHWLHNAVAVLAIVTCGLALTSGLARAQRPRILQTVVLCGWCTFGLLFWFLAHKYRNESAYMSRNLYGVLRADYATPLQASTGLQDLRELFLVDGITIHGAQFQDSSLRREPTTYYGRNSGVGLLLTNLEQRTSPNPEERHIRLGVIGLGAGTLAAYGQAGDYIRYYEINPQVIEAANGKDALFTYIQDSPARIDIKLGDGRILLERELASNALQNFDVLVLDAFSSDSIPVHLLTREAMAIYLHHLRGPHSVLAFHISNKTLDLWPVLAGLAREYKLYAVHVVAGDSRSYGSDWVVMSADGRSLLRDLVGVVPNDMQLAMTQEATLDTASHQWENPALPARLPLWTDDYSNLLQALK